MLKKFRIVPAYFAITVFVYGFSFVFPAFAADLGEIIVEDRGDEGSNKAPSSFTTVIRPSKEESENKSLTEIVSQTPSIVAKSLGGPGQYSTVTIRGSSAEQVTVYIDGVKLNTESGAGVDFSTINVDSIEKIEIIRGGGTAEFGPDAIGGVINIITKKAKKGTEAEIKETFGSFITFKSNESVSHRWEKSGILFSHTHSQSKGDFSFKASNVDLTGKSINTGGTFKRIHNSFISEDAFLKFDSNPAENIWLVFSNDFFFTDRDIPGVEEETTLLYPTNPLEAKEKLFRNASSFQLGFDNVIESHLNIKLGVTNNLNVDHFTDPSPAVGGPIDTKTFYDSVDPFLLFEPTFSNKWAANLIILRYDFKYDTYNDSSGIQNAQLIGKKTRKTNSLFFQDEVLLFSDKLSLIPAVRYEDASDFPDDVSLKIGAAFRPAGYRYITFKGNVETSFRYPSFYELYFPDQGYLRGNPNLNKEEAVNYDIGLAINFSFIKGEVSYFRNDIKNSIIWVPISAFTIQPVNTLDVLSQGVETAIKVNLFKLAYIDANYTYLSARYKGSNLQLPGRPSHTANGKLTLSHNFGEHFGGGIFTELQYMSSLPVNAQNTLFLASRTTLGAGFNIRSYFKKWGTYTLSFDAKDLTNIQIYDARGFPLPRRSYFVTLSGKWGNEREKI